MAYNHGREDRKWRIWKEAEEKLLRECGVDEVTIEQAVAYIRENFASDITLSSLAKRFSVSPEHFSRMFKKETGLGFSKYLNSLRLQHAEQLLKSESRQSITDVAQICGFEDSNYFSKKFKEAYGISPKKVQKKENSKSS